MQQNWLNWRQIIIDDPDLAFGEKAMGLFLNTYMNDNNDFAFPSIATICGRMNIARATAVKHIQGLADKGYLIKQKRYGNTTIYYSNVPERIISSSETELVQELNHSSSETELTVVQKMNSNNQKNNQKNNNRTFASFWESYPKKVDKKKAEVAFNRLTKEKQKIAISDIKTRFNGTDRKFIPNPTTYIHGERWQDESSADNAKHGDDLWGAV